MGMLNGTRKQRAAELRKMVERGPSMFMGYEALTEAQFKYHYQLWVETWVLPELDNLIPELRQANQPKH